MKQLRVIVPSFKPMPSGVADYSLLLAKSLRDSAGIQSSFIVTHPAWDGERRIDGFDIVPLRVRESAKLRSILDADDSPVLLHYTGYEYQRRGCPIWLWLALRQWRRTSDTPFLTILHEFSAFGPPWTSSFWLGPVQHRLAGNIIARSTAVITSRESSAREADRFRRHREPLTRVNPIFSTIGEPTGPIRPLQQRSSRVVVFGNATWRLQAYTTFLDSLEETVRAFGATEVADIGPRCPVTPKSVAGVPVRNHGRLEAEEILAIMGDARAGFVSYPANCLAKSSIFNSYCVSGMVPVVPDRNYPCLDGLQPGREFLMVGQSPLSRDPAHWQVVADEARAWYSGHSIEATARIFGEMLDDIDVPILTPAAAHL